MTRAFTIVELLVSMALFLVLGTLLVGLSNRSLNAWRDAEAWREVYERVEEAFTRLSADLAAAYTLEPAAPDGVPPTARFFCWPDGNGGQILSFVRTFGAGPERTLVHHAHGTSGRVFTDGFTGDPRTLRSLGGLQGVSYWVSDGVLRRATLSPPAAPSGQGLLLTTGSEQGERVVGDVLYLGFRFWHQDTGSWSDTETIWDSTRGAPITILGEDGRERRFRLFVAEESLGHPADDVFPEAVLVTMVVDSRLARATRLSDALMVNRMEARVDSTAVMPGAGVPDYLLIGGEWVRCSGARDGVFILSSRGERGTEPQSHPAGAEVKAGHAFTFAVYLPGFREDRTPPHEIRNRFAR